MKFLILAIIFQSSLLCAQQNDLSKETDLNTTLLNNAAESRRIKQEEADKAAAAAAKAKANGNSNPTGRMAPKTQAEKDAEAKASGSTTDPSNLTDQEKQLAENYIDQTRANNIIKTKCAGDMQAACQGQEGKHSFMGMDSKMVKAVAQAYAIYGAVDGGKLKVKPDPNEPPGENGAKPKEKEETDWCKYIPIGTEALAKFSQQTETQAMQNNPGQNADTAQKDALLKAAKSHENRAKMAKIQMVGWYGGAACYGIKAYTPPGLVMDTSLMIKIGAGVFLGAFYQSEADANEEYAAKVKDIANSLPGKGDCNPITQKTCYCSQPEHKDDPNFCLPGLHSNKIAATSDRVACINNQHKADPTCECRKTNTCLDSFIDANSAPSDVSTTIGVGGQRKSGGAFGSALGLASPLREVRDLSRGELTSGNLGTNSSSGSKAIAKKTLADLASRFPSTATPLNQAQKNLADQFNSHGIPANISNLMAQQSVSKGALDSAMAKFEGSASSFSNRDPVYAARSNVLRFGGGSGLGVSGKQSGKKNDDFLSKFNLNKNDQGGARPRVMEFAERAQQEASKRGQIMKAETPLFEIISNRYQQSGRRLLEIDDKQ